MLGHIFYEFPCTTTDRGFLNGEDLSHKLKQENLKHVWSVSGQFITYASSESDLYLPKVFELSFLGKIPPVPGLCDLRLAGSS